MTLDLNELLVDWDCPSGEICARMVVGRDGGELLQLRIDLGVMQMFPDGRPDGQRHRGLPTVLEYVQHELRLGGADLAAEDWRELERELCQTNYRRLALGSLAEEALARADVAAAQAHLKRALRDIDGCLERLALAVEHGPACVSPGSLALRPTLVFNRGRLAGQLRIAEGRYEEAVEEAEGGAVRLDELLAEFGLDEEQRERDPGVVFLRGLAKRLRREYDIPLTLRERLADALQKQDFETAAQLRDELRRRDAAGPSGSGDSKPP
jgi:hypothetical protein